MVFVITVAVWATIEVVLQIRQFFQGDRATTNEWRSLVVIAVLVWLGGRLARLSAHDVPQLNLPLHGVAAQVVIYVIAWLGIGFRLWSIHSLGRYFRGIVHIQQGHQVVRTGPYRVLRHPSYAGMIVALFGLSLTSANLAAIIVYNVLFLLAVLYRIRVEERVLVHGLGEEYERYMAETSRLIPRVW